MKLPWTKCIVLVFHLVGAIPLWNGQDAENVSNHICEDKSDSCTTATLEQCGTFKELREQCPLTCEICRCEDADKCEGITSSMCTLLTGIKEKCQKTCDICKSKPVNCVWGPWQEGGCFPSCGPGKKTHTRIKTTNENNEGTCNGNYTREEDCKIIDCPIPPKSINIDGHKDRSSVKIKEDTELELKCKVSGANPKPTLEWYKDGVIFNPASAPSESESSSDVCNGCKTVTSTMKFTPTYQDNKASFGCKAGHPGLEADSALEASVILSVLYKPIFLHEHKPFKAEKIEKSFEVIEGESRIINLTSIANPPVLEYSWSRDTILIPKVADALTESRIVALGNGILKVTEASRDDTGIYMATANNSEGTTRLTFKLNVLYAPSISNITKNTVLYAGSTTKITCVIDANPITDKTVKWTGTHFEPATMKSSNNGKAFHLTVSQVTKENAGEFTCIVNNGIGKEVKKSTYIHIKGHISLTSSCGSTSDPHNQSLSTPNYGGGPNADYGYNTNCTWILISPPGMHIRLKSFEYDTEDSYDYLYVYEGNNASDREIAKLSGAGNQSQITSTDNTLYLKFTSDDGKSYSGFKIYYQLFECEQNNDCPTDHTCHDNVCIPYISITSTCGSTSNSKEQSLYTPNYINGTNGRYGNNANCTWSLITEPGTYITLNSFQYATERRNDFLYVYDGTSASNRQVVRLSGRGNQSQITSSGNALYLQFTSDKAKLDVGFKIYAKRAVDCVWANWQQGACTPECGPGKRTDTRVKTTEEANGGLCNGENTQVVDCKDKECPDVKFDGQLDYIREIEDPDAYVKKAGGFSNTEFPNKQISMRIKPSGITIMEKGTEKPMYEHSLHTITYILENSDENGKYVNYIVGSPETHWKTFQFIMDSDASKVVNAMEGAFNVKFHKVSAHQTWSNFLVFKLAK